MGEEQKKLLEQQLWNIANTLRGKMDADAILMEDEITYLSLDENSADGQEYLEAIREEAIISHH